MAYKTGNPALDTHIFSKFTSATGNAAVTLQEVTNKIGFLSVLCLAGFAAGWYCALISDGDGTASNALMISFIAAAFIGWVLIMKKSWARFLAPIFAVLQGFVTCIALYGLIIGVGSIRGGPVILLIFALIVIAGVTMNLKTDVATIRQGIQQGTPKYMSWYYAFSLLVSIDWFFVICYYFFMPAPKRHYK